jgi:hypothetical protein
MAMPAWVSELGVAAQVAIAVVGIWGEKLRAWLFRPRLRLDLLSPSGRLETLAIPVREGDQLVPQFSPARYYHLRVTNWGARPEAREVEVFLTQLDFRGPHGQPQTNYAGALPLRWQHQEYYPTSRTVGRATVAVVDLLFVQPGRLSLMPKPGKPEPYRIRCSPETPGAGGEVEAAADGPLSRAPFRRALVL